MPILVGQALPSAHVEFSKPEYDPTEPIRFRVVVDGEPRRQVEFSGTVTVSGQPIAVSGAATVVGTVEYGSFSAPGYTTIQDPDDPAKYAATPDGGAT
jgi:hypothetical protein